MIRRQENPVAPADRVALRAVPVAMAWVDALFEAARAAFDAYGEDHDKGALLLRCAWLFEVRVLVPTLETVVGIPIDSVTLRMRTSNVVHDPPRVDAYAQQDRGEGALLGLTVPAGLSWWDLRDYLFWNEKDRVRSILAHELTHIADSIAGRPLNVTDPGRGPGDFARYVNSPAEVSAFLQQVVSEVNEAVAAYPNFWRRWRSGSARAWVERLLEASDTWRLMGRYLSAPNDRRIRRAVAASLDRGGALAVFEGPGEGTW